MVCACMRALGCGAGLATSACTAMFSSLLSNQRLSAGDGIDSACIHVLDNNGDRCCTCKTSHAPYTNDNNLYNLSSQVEDML